jgi:peptidyl-prolyl cis-trans isomerase B (cyclophilin B)
MTNAEAPNPVVVVDTSEGVVEIELWADKAPLTVRNFLRYVDEKFFDGTIFHRVIDNFMVQGGGFTADMTQKPTGAPVKNEAAGTLRNLRGTIAMARTNVVDSATAQFFINVADNGFLDHKDNTPKGFGYAVFGKVVKGADVVDRIRKVKTGKKGAHDDVPIQPVTIKSVRRAS